MSTFSTFSIIFSSLVYSKLASNAPADLRTSKFFKKMLRSFLLVDVFSQPSACAVYFHFKQPRCLCLFLQSQPKKKVLFFAPKCWKRHVFKNSGYYLEADTTGHRASVRLESVLLVQDVMRDRLRTETPLRGSPRGELDRLTNTRRGNEQKTNPKKQAGIVAAKAAVGASV